MEDCISNALKEVDMDTFYLTRGDKLREGIVYSYTFEAKKFADNRETITEYNILLNVYVKAEKSISSIRDQVIKAMKKNGFKSKPVPTPNIEGDYVNMALLFKYYKFN